jgi:hypothetical protein
MSDDNAVIFVVLIVIGIISFMVLGYLFHRAVGASPKKLPKRCFSSRRTMPRTSMQWS